MSQNGNKVRMSVNEHESLLRRMRPEFELMPVACIVKDTGLRIRIWNECATKTFGFTADETIGRSPLEFMVPAAYRQDVQAVFERLLGGDTYYHSVNRNLTADGRSIVCEWHNCVLFAPDGSVLGLMSMGQDISGRVDAEELLRTDGVSAVEVFDSLSDCVFIHDAETGAIIDINRRVRDLFGYDPDEVKAGQVGLLSFREEGYTQDLAVEQIRKAAQGTPQVFEWLCQSKSGRVFWVEVQLRSAILGGHMRVLAIVRDITERKQYEARARRFILMQSRDDFVASLAHDLKTPLAATLGVLDLLVEGQFGPVTEEQIEIISGLKESNRSLLAMIDNLLQSYRHESGQVDLKPEPTCPAQIARECADQLLPLIELRRLHLRFEVADNLPLVLVDRFAFRRVLVNLLGNAIKFSPEGSEIAVRLQDSGESVVIAIKDSGPGINPEDQKLLFQRFWQGGLSNAGTGLGLYLCRQIVEAHRGQITCHSRPGAGSTFSVILPALAPGESGR